MMVTVTMLMMVNNVVDDDPDDDDLLFHTRSDHRNSSVPIEEEADEVDPNDVTIDKYLSDLNLIVNKVRHRLETGSEEDNTFTTNVL
jgi:hypothetical protein